MMQSSVLHHSDSTIAPGQGAIHNTPNANRISSKTSPLPPYQHNHPLHVEQARKGGTASTPTGRERCPPLLARHVSTQSQHVGEHKAPRLYTF